MRSPRTGFLLAAAVSLLAGATPAGPTPNELTGTLDVIVEDDPLLGSSRTIYRMRDPESGTLRTLRFARPPGAALVTGTQITVRGIERDPGFDVAADAPIDVLATSSVAMDDRRVVILPVDFLDAPVACSDSMIASIMFDGVFSVDGLYRDSSFELVSFPRDTDGDGGADIHRITIDASIGDACDSDAWADAADVAAANGGVDLAQYQHRVYVLPSTSCSWAGRSNMGCGSSCRSWVDVCNMPDVYAHELGHNLGLRHASHDPDNDDQMDSTYGDLSDFMGLSGSGWRQVNGPHKLQAGWLPAEQVILLDQPGTHTIALTPLETAPAGAVYPQLLRIPRPAMGDDLYVSYRRKLGYDVGLRTEYADRASVHSHDGSDYNTMLISALGDGEQFDDPTTGVSIVQVAHDTMSTTLQVSVPPGSGCGSDTDGDGICDPEDVCPDDAANDADGDGVCAPTDCAPTDPAAFGAPGTVAGVVATRIAGGVRFSWDDQSATAGPGTVYDAIAGRIGDLRAAGGFDTAGCAADDIAQPWFDDTTATPPAGETRYVVLRAQNACPAGTGSYGDGRAPVPAGCD